MVDVPTGYSSRETNGSAPSGAAQIDRRFISAEEGPAVNHCIDVFADNDGVYVNSSTVHGGTLYTYPLDKEAKILAWAQLFPPQQLPR